MEDEGEPSPLFFFSHEVNIKQKKKKIEKEEGRKKSERQTGRKKDEKDPATIFFPQSENETEKNGN